MVLACGLKIMKIKKKVFTSRLKRKGYFFLGGGGAGGNGPQCAATG